MKSVWAEVLTNSRKSKCRFHRHPRCLKLPMSILSRPLGRKIHTKFDVGWNQELLPKAFQRVVGVQSDCIYSSIGLS